MLHPQKPSIPRAIRRFVPVFALLAATPTAGAQTLAVPATSSLYNDWAYPTGDVSHDATATGITACPGMTVDLSTTGCVIDRNTVCSTADGAPFDFRELTAYALIGAWGSDPAVLDATTAAPLAALNVGTRTSTLGSFEVKTSATVAAPTTGGPWFLFLGNNDGTFSDNSGDYTTTLTVSASTCAMDTDGDGYCDGAACGDGSLPGDCDDSNSAVSPGAEEVCDTLDNDCDGLTDDDDPGVVGVPSWFDDLDGDGDGDPLFETVSCEQPVDTAASDGDCDDSDPLNASTLLEVCDGQDNNCDGLVDEDFIDTDEDDLLDCLDDDDDNDGLLDEDEADEGTDPLDPDSDGDGMDDGTEVEVGADPSNPDTDGDGVEDGPDGLGDDDGDGIINVLDPTDDSVPDDDDDSPGSSRQPACGCETQAGSGGGVFALLGALIVLARRRRSGARFPRRA